MVPKVEGADRSSQKMAGIPGGFDFEIQHRSATRHGNADALSRRPCPKRTCYCHDLEGGQVLGCRQVSMGTVGQLSEVFDLGWSREDIVRMQKEDPELSAIYTAVVNGAEQPP